MSDELRSIIKPVLRSQARLKLERSDMGTNQFGAGSNFTLHNITWDWATKAMTSRWPNTRRVRLLDSWIEYTRGTPKSDGIPLAIETNPEIRESSAKPSRKSLARERASSRKNGR